jgi:hypothetical protein
VEPTASCPHTPTATKSTLGFSAQCAKDVGTRRLRRCGEARGLRWPEPGVLVEVSYSEVMRGRLRDVVLRAREVSDPKPRRHHDLDAPKLMFGR